MSTSFPKRPAARSQSVGSFWPLERVRVRVRARVRVRVTCSSPREKG